MLEKLGHAVQFEAEAHDRAYLRRSVWGRDEPVEQDSMGDLDGPGWRLDRQRFERGLRSAVEGRGIRLLAPVHVSSISKTSEGWRAFLSAGATIDARILIDAGGRASRIATQTGAMREVADKLACAWQYAPLAIPETSGATFTQACREGWWYTAALPGGRRILAFHSDADLPVMRTRMNEGLIGFARQHETLAQEIADADWRAAGEISLCAAHGARLDRVAGEHWIAVGDAASAFDPLSSQGLFHALYTGMRAGEVARAMIAAGSETEEAAQYRSEIDSIWRAYLAHSATYYGAERRFADATFWQRRH